MGSYIRDLTLKIVVLGWIYAKNARHKAYLGHVFQPNPPAIVRRPDGGVYRSRNRVWAVLIATITVASLCQYGRWRLSRLS